MRIIGGSKKGTALTSLGKGDLSAQLRPTSDRLRESIFNLLQHGDYPEIEGARVLDLFAGSGALGFEALSRGAEFCLFVENGAKASMLIRKNTEILGFGSKAKHFKRDATKLGAVQGAPFSLVFLDPPYHRALGDKALLSAKAHGWLAVGATIIWEEGAKQTIPPGFTLQDMRQYGDSFLHILTAD